ncbi:MAG: hypothetical protein WB820_17700, partial [Rhodoplanes sp.]
MKRTIVRSDVGHWAFKPRQRKKGYEEAYFRYIRRIAAFGASARLLSSQSFEVREIVVALLHPAVVARLVLYADEAVRAATAVGRHVEIANCLADRIFDMRPQMFSGLQRPGLAPGVGEKVAKLAAMRALAGELARPQVLCL